MSKRTRSPTTSPSKSKRSKTQTNQFQIDQFFGSAQAKVQHPAEKSKQQLFVQGSSRTSNAGTPTHTAATEVIDVDAIDLTEEPESNKVPEAAAFSLGSIENSNEMLTSKPPTIPKVSQTPDSLVFSALDIDPLDYDPEVQPCLLKKAPYALLTHALVTLSQTRSRIAILNTLTNVLRTIILKYPSSLLPAVYLLSNSLGPQFIPIELGLGSAIITRSIQQVSGVSSAALKKLYNATGDPGDVAFAAKSNLRTLIPHAALTIDIVYESLLKISRCKGQGAAKEKQKIVEKLLLAASGEEVRYLTRTLCQNLRVGAVRTSILSALARSMVLTPLQGVLEPSDGAELLHVSTALLSKLRHLSSSKGKSSATEKSDLIPFFKKAESLIKQVYAKHPSYDQIIPALLEKGLQSLAERVPLTVGLFSLTLLTLDVADVWTVQRCSCTPYAGVSYTFFGRDLQPVGRSPILSRI